MKAKSQTIPRVAKRSTSVEELALDRRFIVNHYHFSTDRDPCRYMANLGDPELDTRRYSPGLHGSVLPAGEPLEGN